MEIILKAASAGTMESSDAYVEVEPGSNGLDIHVESVVAQQFGQAIEDAVKDVLQEQKVENAVVRVVDRGALDCVLRARVEAALLRAMEEQ